MLLVLVSLAAAVAAAASTFVSPASARHTSSAYLWPVKPFGQPHPVRANFGDPRTDFAGKPSAASLFRGSGIFQLHFGIDISVPDGTPVYPVRSGTVLVEDHEHVAVVSDDSVSFGYWHIIPSVRNGQHVTAFKTILGRVRKGYEHVHLSELHNGVPVNPLAAGHLGPYADHTRPAVTAISLRRPGRPVELIPEFVRGTLDVVAAASDTPALRVPGRWGGLPVAPALVTWKIVRVIGRRTVVRTHVGFDVRRTLPDAPFWSVYARGTRQNMATFHKHRFWRQPGVYLYRLARFDTRTLKNGVYDLVVTASDTRGNSGSLTQRFTILNGR